MIVQQYGLTYTRITVDDIELVRYWRNQEFIRNTIQFKEYITPLMQQQWFKNIDNKYNYYFIIHFQNKKIGLINCKDSTKEKVAEGGIFIWDKSFWGTSVPAFASLAMLQAVFDEFQSGEASIATISKENTLALDFNLKLGYQIIGETDDKQCYKLYLTKKDYDTKTKKLIRAAAILTGQPHFKLWASVSDKQSDEINAYIVKHQITPA